MSMTATLTPITLDDKYVASEGRIFLTATQALVKLPLLQRRLDAVRGLNTAGFISGYRGSPLGNLDAELWAARRFLEENHIRFQPGVNEDLAATACWGTQQVKFLPGAKYDGVFAMWYGKGPGVDRAGDPFKHGNMAGTSRHGGVLVLTGDDHGGKSSTTAHQSEQALLAAMIPVLNPASIQDYLDFGVIGWGMSRFAGLWVGFKCLTETVETSGTVIIDRRRFDLMQPEGVVRAGEPVPHFAPSLDEELMLTVRLPAAQAFARANGIDQAILWPERRRLGIVAVGKAALDAQDALDMLGLSPDRAQDLGIGLFKVGLSWPLEPVAIGEFARGFDELLVIEEKRALVEDQLARLLYNMPADQRPRLAGKKTPDGAPLLAAHGELPAESIALALAGRLSALGLEEDVSARRDAIAARLQAAKKTGVSVPVRTPGFCSGCPHNTSTKLPEGSVAFAGIGCHTMAMFLGDRPTMPATQMGGEGANWIGMSAFTDTPHVFQNLGDGTYFHSGLMAVRAAVASGANITYKILYNDAVAMTGGQPVDGPLSVPDVASQLRAERVQEIVIVTDEPHKYRGVALPAGISVHHRDELLAVERRLREVKGVSALIYDQVCAAEKRRRRKRGAFPDPAKRYFINTAVCEGCGDCGRQSNCASLVPVETSFGRKRQIDQATCNKDYSCVKGFCPSFVTVLGGELRSAPARAVSDLTLPELPSPTLPPLQGVYNLVVTGIGGTGVVTVGAVLGMAAHLEGHASRLLDLTGLSQKNGAVMSHVRLAATGEHLTAGRIGVAQADAVIGCDLVVAAGVEAARTYDRQRTRAVVNSHIVPTMAFQQNPDMSFDRRRLLTALSDRAEMVSDGAIDATQAAMRLFGSNILANMLMVGFAWQKGLVPISEEAILKAIELNGVSVTANHSAFRWGRFAAADPHGFRRHVYGNDEEPGEPAPQTFEEMLGERQLFLADYQSRRYGRAFRRFVDDVTAREEAMLPGSRVLSTVVARNLFKLMAYKDEYEVARLYTDGRFQDELRRTFRGDITLRFNLAPPLLARHDKLTGHLQKREFGWWLYPVFTHLAKFRFLRGTPFDPFGYTAERRAERTLIVEYKKLVQQILEGLTPQRLAQAVEIAERADKIRGFGHIKEAAIAEYRKDIEKLLSAYQKSPRDVAA
ncbi:MAG: indolepyruvate ferredoxin oxidoreductase family protein [Sphingomonadales bacterium]|nr:indolepyruvate ferredoxin oxidoreductase family protein [Sphingomonadales bacterium]